MKSLVPWQKGTREGANQMTDAPKQHMLVRNHLSRMLGFLSFQAFPMWRDFSGLCFEEMRYVPPLHKQGFFPSNPCIHRAQSSSTPWGGYWQCPSVAEGEGKMCISKAVYPFPQAEESIFVIQTRIHKSWSSLLRVTRNGFSLKHLCYYWAVALESPGVSASAGVAG